MATVAKRAGVSTMTVSNVINGRNVKPAIRQAVLAAIRDLHYTPNVAARALASASAPCIGLVHNQVASPYTSAAVFGALEAASRLGVQLLLEKINGDGVEAAFEAMDVLIDRGANALLVPPPTCEAISRDAQISAYTIPLMGMSPGSELDTLSSVRIDDFAAARDMATLLISKGHSRIGFVQSPPNHIVHRTRRDGYLSALSTFGITMDETLIVMGDMRFESGLAAAKTLLELPQPPTAIFASTDDMAAAAIAVAHQHNLRIPDDLVVAGFDDSPLATRVWPPLTSVRQPIVEMAGVAVEQLAALVREAGGAPRPVITTYQPYQIIRRASTGD